MDTNGNDGHGGSRWSTTHELTLVWRDDCEETILATGCETVLDAAERAGVSLPFGCLTGACATCVGRVVDGRIEHVRPPRALKSRHVKSGYVLCCIAQLRADCQIEVGMDVQTDLVSNPWK